MSTDLKARPPVLRALGRKNLPEKIEIGGSPYRLESEFKHDSWAATGCYRDGAGNRAICKFNRTQPLGFVPAGWIGRWLADREAWFLDRLADVEGVPALLGEVSADGRQMPNAVARAFIDGHAFTQDDTVDEAFFERLEHILAAVHARDIAYVDLHKRENVVIDTGGDPHLIDFQVCYRLSRRWPLNGRLGRAVLRQLQEMDNYHVRKHIARHLPHKVGEEGFDAFVRRPALINFHREIAYWPRHLRRRLLVMLKIRDDSGLVESELDAEVAFRKRQTDRKSDG